MTASASPLRHRVQWVGLLAGPLIALAVTGLLPASYPNAEGTVTELGSAGRATLAMLVWMAIWWLTEAIEIAATALLPVALFPLLGVASPRAAAAPYASELIFLFLGGFLIAYGMQRWGLDRRFALLVLRWVGPRPGPMVAGFMAVTAVLSAFVSNTATAAMMLPIALSVVALVEPEEAGERGASDQPDQPDQPTVEGRNFGLCLMLGIAYSASIGGITTLIGTPPNGIMAQFVRDQLAAPHGREIGFAQWLMVGLPLALVFLPIVWLLLTRVLFPIRLRRLEGGQALIERQLQDLGRPRVGEWVVAVVFLLTAVAWIGRPLWQRLLPGAQLSDAGIAMLAGVSLFVLPVDLGERRFALDWETARRLPWGVLVLFGGGLSLASAVRTNGVAEFIGSQVLVLRHAPTPLLVLAVTTLVIFLTELTSNTATTATLLPILAAVATGLGLHPLLLVIPATLAASCAFMMPVATPPNAIIFGSGRVTLPQMARAGIWLNLIGIVLVMALTYLVVLPLWGSTPGPP